MASGYESGADGSYTESSPFVRLFATPSRVKILDLFIRKHYEELTASDVEALADVSRSTFHRNVGELQALGVIEQTGTMGNSKTFQLNKDNELAKTLASSHADILEHATDVLSTTEDPVERALLSAIDESSDGEDTSNDSDGMADTLGEAVAKSLTG